MWSDIKDTALNIVRSDERYRTLSHAGLDEWMLSTGYQSAGQAHTSTKALLYTFAASLCNAGGPGPGFQAFAEMVAGAADGYIVQNILQPVDLPQFSDACYLYLAQADARPLAKNGRVDYPEDIRQMAGGLIPRRSKGVPVVLQLLTGVVGFMDFLRLRYQGDARVYHAAFDRPHHVGDPTEFVVERFQEIAHLSRVGVAVAMNFFKDSQAPALRGQPLASALANQTGWYIKPDMHVLRLMLRATGRSHAAGVSDKMLVTLKESEAARLYGSQAGTGIWSAEYQLHRRRPNVERGKWDCVEDVHRWASMDAVAPLEIDRTLYLVGSGRYGTGKRLAMSQAERYHTMFAAMRV